MQYNPNDKGPHLRKMIIIQAKDYDEMSRKAALFIASQVLLKPNCLLGLATGSTPVGTYQELIRFHEEDGLSFQQVRTVNLDEYYGLPASTNKVTASSCKKTFSIISTFS